MTLTEICMRYAILLLFSLSFVYGQVVFSEDYDDVEDTHTSGTVPD